MRHSLFFASLILGILNVFSAGNLPAESNILLNKSAVADKKLVYLDPYYETEFYPIVRNYDAAAHLVTDGNYETYWESFSRGESLTVDLQVVSTINKLYIHWGEKFATSFEIYVSDDLDSEMKKIGTFRNSGTLSELSLNTKLRYLKVLPLETSVSDNTCSILEMEADGNCSFKAQTYSIKPSELSAGLYLTGGNWKIQRDENVEEDGYSISKVGYKASTWLPAVVPGTVLTSYIDAKAVPDIRYSDNQKQLSETFFQSDFWYRNEFYVPKEYSSFPKLVFTGISYRIHVYLNGYYVGKSEDVFKRSEFDISECIKPGEENALAVLVETVDNPGLRSVQTLRGSGRNAGFHSTDSPAFFSSIGWDWIPSVPDRNIGLWNHVYISRNGSVSVKDPYVVSKVNLPDTTMARLSFEATLINNESIDRDATLRISFDNRVLEKLVQIKANQSVNIKLSDKDYAELLVNNPKLWWPNGYGNQNLYQMNVKVLVDNKVSDEQTFNFGIRELNTRLEDNVLNTYVNGRRIFIRGGNIGGTDITRRLEPERYDRMIRLHKEMNFNAVRNWVGQTAHSEFYEACDKYGILIWDDFWMSSGGIELVPLNFPKFMSSVRDKILQVRNHPSVMVYCGRNENYPPKYFNDSIASSIKELDPYRYYATSSAHNGLTGFGPYTNQEPQWYFKNRGMIGPQLHTEIGCTCVPSLETIKRIVPSDKLWPINDVWGIHDFTMSGAQNASNYLKMIEKRFGKALDILTFCNYAQMLNYETHKAMFECYAANPASNGLMMWMSQSAWPSFVWQTFDYYYDQTAAFFACKTATEPVHILWDSYRNRTSVTNRSLYDLNDITAKIELYDINGKLLSSRDSVMSLKSGEVKNVSMPNIGLNNDSLYFIKLKMLKGKELLSDNFYWWQKDNNYKALNDLDKGVLKIKTKKKDEKLYITVENKSSNVVPIIRFKILNIQSELLEPVVYSDNYFGLLPDEQKTISVYSLDGTIEYNDISLYVEGLNVENSIVKM